MIEVRVAIMGERRDGRLAMTVGLDVLDCMFSRDGIESEKSRVFVGAMESVTAGAVFRLLLGIFGEIKAPLVDVNAIKPEDLPAETEKHLQILEDAARAYLERKAAEEQSDDSDDGALLRVLAEGLRGVAG